MVQRTEHSVVQNVRIRNDWKQSALGRKFCVATDYLTLQFSRFEIIHDCIVKTIEIIYLA